MAQKWKQKSFHLFSFLRLCLFFHTFSLWLTSLLSHSASILFYLIYHILFAELSLPNIQTEGWSTTHNRKHHFPQVSASSRIKRLWSLFWRAVITTKDNSPAVCRHCPQFMWAPARHSCPSTILCHQYIQRHPWPPKIYASTFRIILRVSILWIFVNIQKLWNQLF